MKYERHLKINIFLIAVYVADITNTLKLFYEYTNGEALLFYNL